MNSRIRLSCTRTVACGQPKPDWTKQSSRMFQVNKGDGTQIKKSRAKCFRGQVCFGPDGMPSLGQTVKMARPVRIPITLKNGQPGEKEVFEGTWNNRTVRRDGYAYALVKNGKTPGRWYLV